MSHQPHDAGARGSSRRQILKTGAALAGGAVLAAPALVSAQAPPKIRPRFP